ncbi:phosphoserine phosphatase SerB [Helicobacter monodelphidis]|uniref:phosphoserine phosphatase SerB n=1 Tax=Helicobacter sp. 15-1451 TaxID=2004995 RepID=UPI000DCE81DF|nr:phosphoserine phosphatase SerB [Helicobacter sp. 15-1451]RAX56738.1 phosphoserine phosphatase SerB [Helicobacter sp. 15-1451]
MKLAVFDFDSTLMDGETIEFLADAMDVLPEVKSITQKAMAGELDFYESLVYRVSLLKGMSVSRMSQICESLPLILGGAELIAWLKNHHYKVVVMSGGFRTATLAAKSKLHFDADFSNILHHKDGVLSGEVGGEMMFSYSKGDMIERLQQILDIPKEHTLAVGDGANDLSMFAKASVKVAFCAKPILREAADICIDQKDLRLIIPHIEKF